MLGTEPAGVVLGEPLYPAAGQLRYRLGVPPMPFQEAHT